MSTIKASIPGLAFGALRESGLPQRSPELWTRVLNHSATMRRGRGLTIHLDLEEDDLRTIRDCLNQLNKKYDGKSYQERGLEGNVMWQSIGNALGRLDDALSGR